MTLQHYKEVVLNRDFPKLKDFIRKLITEGIGLQYIDTNDWECNYKPSVYVHNKKNMFLTKRYKRCSDFDVKQALSFYNN